MVSVYGESDYFIVSEKSFNKMGDPMITLDAACTEQDIYLPVLSDYPRCWTCLDELIRAGRYLMG